MAKKSYKIPTSLDSSFLDVELALQGSSGVGLRPLPMKTILAALGSGFVCAWIVTQSFVAAGGPLLIIPFVLLWALATWLLVRSDGLGGIKASWVPVAIEYMTGGKRRVKCRVTDMANEFRGVCRIANIDYDRGLIEFTDGTWGYAYSVVGSGSVLLFDEDRDAIIDRCDTFFRKMHTDYELIFLTVKEPQHVEKQVAAMDRRIARLQGGDPELLALARAARHTLAEGVGKNFRSIHQYMIIKADNREALDRAKNMFVSECENSTLVFKRAAALFGSDIDTALSSLFKGKETV